MYFVAVRCLTPMGIWCSVVFANSGFISSVLASTLFHQVQKNGIVHFVHKSWCVNELYLY